MRRFFKKKEEKKEIYMEDENKEKERVEKHSEIHTPEEMMYYEDEIDLAELFGILKKRKNIVFGTAAFFFVLALAYILLVMVLKMELYEIYSYSLLGFKDVAGYSDTDIKLVSWSLPELQGAINNPDWVENNIKNKYPKDVYKKIKGLKIEVEQEKIGRQTNPFVKIYMYYPNKNEGKRLLKIVLEEVEAYLNKKFFIEETRKALKGL